MISSSGTRVGGPLLAAMLLALPLAAQRAPGTDIWITFIARSGKEIKVGSPLNFTDRKGYDNQPSFSPDSKFVYFTAQGMDQTEISLYDVNKRQITAVTSTPESEYSPTVMPGGKQLSVIRVELDSAQRLWSIGMDGKPVAPIFKALKPVGYHAWLNADTLFVFILGNPATLQRAVVSTQSATVLAKDIGRGIFRIPGKHLISYVQHDSTGNTIRTIDPVTGESRALVRLPKGNEFYTWTPQGEILSADGNRLLIWREGAADWTEIAKFAEPGLQKLSRLAVSPDGNWLALVSEEPRS